MNKVVNLASVLPDTSFVGFLANLVRNPVAIWNNSEIGTEIALDEYSYFLPLSNDANVNDSNQVRRFLGERYGGQGLAGNGGGVRCGLLGNVQIKGIGRNPLAGVTTDFFHSYGGASVNEGIAEALWGEIFHRILPFGAARIYGLVLTGTRVPLLKPREGQDPTTARALILRQALVRPAHYMRSVYFDAGPDMQNAPSDTMRTRAAIETMGQAFAELYGGMEGDAQDPAYLSARLTEMFDRFAKQIAAARAKRIMHGSLMASNLGLDGRWLDFSTTSSMPDYGHIIISPRTPDFMREEMMLQETAWDLPFYIRKYLPNGRGEQIIPPAQLWAGFEEALRKALPNEFLKLTGIPAQRLPDMADAARLALYRCMQSIIRSGNRTVYTVLSQDADVTPMMPERAGHFHLNTILSLAALSRDEQETDSMLAAQLGDALLRREFIRCYWLLRRAYLEQFSIEQRPQAGLFLALNALRLNAPMPAFYRANLYGAIEQLLHDEGDITQFIDTLLCQANTAWLDAGGGSMPLDAWFGCEASCSERDGFRIAGSKTTLQEALARLRPGILSSSYLDLLARYDH